MHRSALAGALPQGGFEIDGTVVLAQKVPEGFVREFLKIHHPVVRQKVERRPGFIVELEPLAGHRRYSAAPHLALRHFSATTGELKS